MEIADEERCSRTKLLQSSRKGLRKLILVDGDDVIAAESDEEDVGREAVEPVFRLFAVRFGFPYLAERRAFGGEHGVAVHANQDLMFPDRLFELFRHLR